MQILIFLFLIAPVQIFAQTDCLYYQSQSKNTLACSQIFIEQEPISSGADKVLVILNNEFSMNLTVFKTANGIIQDFSYLLGDRSLPYLNHDDALLIDKIAREISLRNLGEQFYLINFFSNLPINESLQPLTTPSGEVPWPKDKDDKDEKSEKNGANLAPKGENKKPFYSSICRFVGKKQTASFVFIDTRYSLDVTVGDVKNKCIGRCGYGCNFENTPSPRTAYTQECLDHDFCHRHTGENLGVCAPYFLRATPSFLFAPNCVKA